MTGLLYSIPLITIGAASVFGWMLAYLRGPAVVSEWIARPPATIPFMIMLLLVAAVRHRRRLHRRHPGDHHLHADHHRPDQERRHQSGAHGRRHHRHAGVRADHAALRARAADGVEIRRRQFSASAMFASLPIYIVFFAAIAFCIFLPEVVLWLPKHLLPESVGCFRNPSGAGYHLPLTPTRTPVPMHGFAHCRHAHH